MRECRFCLYVYGIIISVGYNILLSIHVWIYNWYTVYVEILVSNAVVCRHKVYLVALLIKLVSYGIFEFCDTKA